MLWMILLLGFFFLGASGLLALFLAPLLALGPSASSPAVRGAQSCGACRRPCAAPPSADRVFRIELAGLSVDARRHQFRRRSWRPAPAAELRRPLNASMPPTHACESARVAAGEGVRLTACHAAASPSRLPRRHDDEQSRAGRLSRRRTGAQTEPERSRKVW